MYNIEPIADLLLLLITWLVIAFLPRVLRWVKLEDRFERKHLSLLNTALLGVAVWIAVIAPFARYLMVFVYGLTHLHGL